MSRILLVSNRLPITIREEAGNLVVSPSSGGLATGLKRLHEQSEGLWFGWPGPLDGLDEEQQEHLLDGLKRQRTVPIWLSEEEIRGYYDGFSNGVLWPICHYLLERVSDQSADWDVYRHVNERFADIVADAYRDGDLIWVQDFHLLLLPELLRKRIPEATIGFFFHTPFPSYEVFRLLPWREALLRGVLGSDVIGFHTAGYLRHFMSSILRILGIEANVGLLRFEGREIELRIFPMGVDAAHFTQMADDPMIVGDADALRQEHGDVKLVLGVDRLDYTKGIPQRLLAIERLLEREPSLRDHVKFIQVAVPSRLDVEAYDEFRGQVDRLVGRINGTYGTLGSQPVHYLFQSFPQRQIVVMYRAADVMLVTPLRDGMNLVAKEYVACRNEEDGVLILSEFAGASSQLGEALSVNPYDIDGVADAIKRAITMPLDEQESRMTRLRDCVVREDVHHWASTFMQALERGRHRSLALGKSLRSSSPDTIERLLDQIRHAERLALLLDYDGTLVPFASVPELAEPGQGLLALLHSLAERPRTSVHVVSGRKQEQIDRWLRGLPIGLHAEHGLWSRWRPDQDWTRLEGIEMEWKDQVRPILDEFAERTFGALVEEKGASLVWHYRRADVEYGALQAKELRLHLLEMLSNYPVQILAGEKNVEVRTYGVHKGTIVSSLLEETTAPTLFVAMGDDRTDEDLFAAMPEDGISIHVGPASSRAPFRLSDPSSVRDFLERLADAMADSESADGSKVESEPPA
jgi:trehalose 6-phosphate synthase/phosphatase